MFIYDFILYLQHAFLGCSDLCSRVIYIQENSVIYVRLASGD